MPARTNSSAQASFGFVLACCFSNPWTNSLSVGSGSAAVGGEVVCWGEAFKEYAKSSPKVSRGAGLASLGTDAYFIAASGGAGHEEHDLDVS